LILKPRTSKRPTPIDAVAAKDQKDQIHTLTSDSKSSTRCLSPGTLPVPTNTPNPLQTDTHTHTDRGFTHMSDDDLYG
jgi:hypothetical protein